MSEVRKVRTSKGIYTHWCLHKDCKKWGAYGYKSRYGQHWFCFDHKAEGEQALNYHQP